MVAGDLGLLGATHRCCAMPWGMWNALVYGIAAGIQTRPLVYPNVELQPGLSSVLRIKPGQHGEVPHI